MALLLTEQDVTGLLTMDIALEALEEAFRLQAEGKATNSPRSRMRLPNGSFIFMTAAAPGMGVMGLKAYGATRGHPARFYVQLSSTDTGELLALIEASALGQIRTDFYSKRGARTRRNGCEGRRSQRRTPRRPTHRHSLRWRRFPGFHLSAY